MKLSQFDFELPDELIAQEPVKPRDKCRLLIVKKKDRSLSDGVFRNLTKHLASGDVLVLNDSRVIPARIRLPVYGAKAEILLIRKVRGSDWLVMGRPGKLLKMGSRVVVNEKFSFCVLSVNDSGQRTIRFSLKGAALSRELDSAGSTPLPPYISRPGGDPKRDYQTVYARKNGSVAAPTAGLHFTPLLLGRLKKIGVKIAYVTLHVGPGTFLPVKTEDVRDHKMHSEWFCIGQKSVKTLNEAYAKGKRIIAVGTTSVRVLESAFKEGEGFKKVCGETSIFIYPGYKWKCVKGIITNFHLPKSTLLMLVSSFEGRKLMMKAYKTAIRRKYRFYSYGDAMLLL